MLETRKVDIITRKEGAFRKPTSIIRNRYALEECPGSRVCRFIYSSAVSIVYR